MLMGVKILGKINSTQKGFTLVEVLVSAAMLVIVVLGVSQLFVYCSLLTDTSGNLTIAMSEAQSKMDEIRNSTYSTIATNYASGGSSGNTFDLTQTTGKGAIYIDSSNTSLLQVKITVSWRDRNRRIVGEDLDLDGALDGGEDTNSSGQLDSPATIICLIAQR